MCGTVEGDVLPSMVCSGDAARSRQVDRARLLLMVRASAMIVAVSKRNAQTVAKDGPVLIVFLSSVVKGMSVVRGDVVRLQGRQG